MNYILLILTVILGVLISYIFKNRWIQNSKMLLTFSGAYLLGVAILHLLPEVYHHNEGIEIFILLGVVLQILLEFFSKGLEHGHIHHDSKDKTKVPLMLFVSLCIHAFMEGMPIHNHSHEEGQEHLNHLLSAIVVHKVAISIIITSFFINSKMKFQKIAVFLLIFSLMTPFGSLVVNVLPVLQKLYTQINAVVFGTFLHISTVILFESSENHKFNFKKIMMVLLGMLLAYVINF